MTNKFRALTKQNNTRPLTLALPYVTNYITAQHFHVSLLQELAPFTVYHHSRPVYLLVCFTYYSRD